MSDRSAVTTAIPAEDLVRQHAAIADELRAAFEDVLPVGKYTLGRQLTAFEAEFAAYVGARHGIGISTGTAALHLALVALGVGPGDEVVTVPNTYVATAFAISYAGATPVFVDVDPLTSNLDPARLPEVLSEHTKAILPVHLYGQAVDIDAVRAIAPGIPILEDAAHAHGADLRGRPVGSLGEAAAFSLLPEQAARRPRRRRSPDDERRRTRRADPAAALHGTALDQARTPRPRLPGAPR